MNERAINEVDAGRLYDFLDQEGSEHDARLFLVDRLWPRGVAKERLHLDGWPKELAPSNELRKAFHAGNLEFEDFAERYREELDRQLDEGELDSALNELREAGASADGGRVVLLYGAKDTEQNHALVIRDWLRDLLRSEAE